MKAIELAKLLLSYPNLEVLVLCTKRKKWIPHLWVRRALDTKKSKMYAYIAPEKGEQDNV